MKVALVAIGIIAVALGTGAQETVQNAASSAAAEARSAINKVDGRPKITGSKNENSNNPPVVLCVECFNAPTVETPRAETKAEQTEADSLDRLYRRYLWATIVGVGGGLVGVFLLVWQTILLRRSTNAAKVSADAAKLNAQAVINAERAWVEAEIVKTSVIGSTRYEVRIENKGKTPAKLSAYRFDFGQVEKDGTWSRETLTGHQFDRLNFFLGSGKIDVFMEGFDIRRMFQNLSNYSQDVLIGFVCITIVYSDVVGAEPNDRDGHTTYLVYQYDLLPDSLRRIPILTQYT